MTKFDELSEALSKRREAETQYCRENEAIARAISEGLHDYLQMPKHYDKPGGGRDPYISYRTVNEDGTTTEADHFFASINHRTDGSFNFAFAIALEPAPNTFPKTRIGITVNCVRRQSEAKIEIMDQTMDCKFDGETLEGVEKVHDTIFEIIMKYLSHRPGDGWAKPKYGFAVL